MKYCTTKEKNEIFDLRVKTIQRLIRKNKIKPYKIGNSFSVVEMI